MSSIVTTVRIPAPIGSVWRELSSIDRHTEWMTDAEAITFRTASTKGVGTRMAVRTRVGPFTTCDEMEVTWWQPQRGIGVSHRGVVSGSGVFAIVPDGDGTLLIWFEHLRFPTRLGGSAGALIARPILLWIWRRNLRRFASRFTDSQQ